MKIYVASSWRNENQPAAVELLRDAGHEVYDFRNPESGNHGFHWSEVDGAYQCWTAGEYVDGLNSDAASGGFKSDMDALTWCDTCVLLLPCNRSAHLELGWCVGQGKRTVIVLDDEFEPELMYKMVDRICVSVPEVVEFLQENKNAAA